MRKIILKTALIISISVFAWACKSSTNTANPASNPSEIKEIAASKEYTIDVEASSLEWKGENIIAGRAHTGNIKFKEGVLGVEGNLVVSGKMLLDITTITNNDLKEKALNDKLVKHLKSDDFFSVGSFPTATLEIATIEALASPTVDANNTVTANLSIKGITKKITFPAMIKVSDIGVLANAKLEFNRKDWNVMYGTEGSLSALTKDKVIKNEISISVNIIAK